MHAIKLLDNKHTFNMVISRKQLVHGVAFGFILSINLTALLLNAVKTRIYCKYGGSVCVTVLSLSFFIHAGMKKRVQEFQMHIAHRWHTTATMILRFVFMYECVVNGCGRGLFHNKKTLHGDQWHKIAYCQASH